ncbi:uncharacterized protein LOC107009659 [Solanum pennellii]|uniref:Uncharacterized protein LOC107009659 n=1 Tax=Solanum pennellii TaxID=28526 RepID=A0ABM1G185_SOLPN|nr:uncharacterized protein LOC107009659 [Solanum pennellii]
MEQAITMKSQAMTYHVNRQNVQRENPQVLSMADRLRDFMRMNPHIFTGSKTSEDPQEFVGETWCKMWQDSRALGGVSVTWEYATSLVSNSRDEMSRFLTGINGDLEEQCRSAMLHDYMDLSRLMVHVQQVEDSRKKRGVRDARRNKPQHQAGPSNGGNRNNFGIREQPRFKKGQ